MESSKTAFVTTYFSSIFFSIAYSMYDKTANPRSTLTTTVNKGKNQRNFPLLVKMEGCFSVEAAGSSLISLGAVLFAIVLAQATLSSGRPTEQLGKQW